MRASNILLSKICYKNIVNNIYCSKYMVYISVFFNVIIKKKRIILVLYTYCFFHRFRIFMPNFLNIFF